MSVQDVRCAIAYYSTKFRMDIDDFLLKFVHYFSQDPSWYSLRLVSPLTFALEHIYIYKV